MGHRMNAVENGMHPVPASAEASQYGGYMLDPNRQPRPPPPESLPDRRILNMRKHVKKRSALGAAKPQYTAVVYNVAPSTVPEYWLKPLSLGHSEHARGRERIGLGMSGEARPWPKTKSYHTSGGAVLNGQSFVVNKRRRPKKKAGSKGATAKKAGLAGSPQSTRSPYQLSPTRHKDKGPRPIQPKWWPPDYTEGSSHSDSDASSPSGRGHRPPRAAKSAGGAAMDERDPSRTPKSQAPHKLASSYPYLKRRRSAAAGGGSGEGGGGRARATTLRGRATVGQLFKQATARAERSQILEQALAEDVASVEDIEELLEAITTETTGDEQLGYARVLLSTMFLFNAIRAVYNSPPALGRILADIRLKVLDGNAAVAASEAARSPPNGAAGSPRRAPPALPPVEDRWCWNAKDRQMFIRHFADLSVIQQFIAVRRQLGAMGPKGEAATKRVEREVLLKVVNDFSEQLGLGAPGVGHRPGGLPGIGETGPAPMMNRPSSSGPPLGRAQGEPAAMVEEPFAEVAGASATEHGAEDVPQEGGGDGPAGGEEDDKVEWAHLLVVSSRLPAVEDLVDAANDNVSIVLFDWDSCSLPSLAEAVRMALEGQRVQSLAVATHGKDGSIGLVQKARTNLRSIQRPELQDFWKQLVAHLQPGVGHVLIIEPDISATEDGRALVDQLEQLMGVPVVANPHVLSSTGWPSASDTVERYFDTAALRLWFAARDEATAAMEAQRRAQEAAAQAAAAEAARIAEEEALRRKAEELARRYAEEEAREAAERAAAEAAARVAAEQEAARMRAEEEARVQAEEQARRREEAARREEEAAAERALVEQEARQVARALAAEEEARALAEEEARIRAAQARARLEEEYETKQWEMEQEGKGAEFEAWVTERRRLDAVAAERGGAPDGAVEAAEKPQGTEDEEGATDVTGKGEGELAAEAEDEKGSHEGMGQDREADREGDREEDADVRQREVQVARADEDMEPAGGEHEDVAEGARVDEDGKAAEAAREGDSAAVGGGVTAQEEQRQQEEHEHGHEQKLEQEQGQMLGGEEPEPGQEGEKEPEQESPKARSWSFHGHVPQEEHGEEERGGAADVARQGDEEDGVTRGEESTQDNTGENTVTSPEEGGLPTPRVGGTEPSERDLDSSRMASEGGDAGHAWDDGEARPVEAGGGEEAGSHQAHKDEERRSPDEESRESHAVDAAELAQHAGHENGGGVTAAEESENEARPNKEGGHDSDVSVAPAAAVAAGAAVVSAAVIVATASAGTEHSTGAPGVGHAEEHRAQVDGGASAEEGHAPEERGSPKAEVPQGDARTHATGPLETAQAAVVPAASPNDEAAPQDDVVDASDAHAAPRPISGAQHADSAVAIRAASARSAMVDHAATAEGGELQAQDGGFAVGAAGAVEPSEVAAEGPQEEDEATRAAREAAETAAARAAAEEQEARVARKTQELEAALEAERAELDSKQSARGITPHTSRRHHKPHVEGEANAHGREASEALPAASSVAAAAQADASASSSAPTPASPPTPAGEALGEDAAGKEGVGASAGPAAAAVPASGAAAPLVTATSGGDHLDNAEIAALKASLEAERKRQEDSKAVLEEMIRQQKEAFEKERAAMEEMLAREKREMEEKKKAEAAAAAAAATAAAAAAATAAQATTAPASVASMPYQQPMAMMQQGMLMHNPYMQGQMMMPGAYMSPQQQAALANLDARSSVSGSAMDPQQVQYAAYYQQQAAAAQYYGQMGASMTGGYGAGGYYGGNQYGSSLVAMQAPVQAPAAGAQQAMEDAPTPEEIDDYARYLGMDPVADKELLYIAEWALTAPLPDGWTEHQDGTGNEFYYNSMTGVSTYEHPLDEQYRTYYRQLKAQKVAA